MPRAGRVRPPTVSFQVCASHPPSLHVRTSISREKGRLRATARVRHERLPRLWSPAPVHVTGSARPLFRSADAGGEISWILHCGSFGADTYWRRIQVPLETNPCSPLL